MAQGSINTIDVQSQYIANVIPLIFLECVSLNKRPYKITRTRAEEMPDTKGDMLKIVMSFFLNKK